MTSYMLEDLLCDVNSSFNKWNEKPNSTELQDEVFEKIISYYLIKKNIGHIKERLDSLSTKDLMNVFNIFLDLDNERKPFYSGLWNELIAPETIVQQDFLNLSEEYRMYQTVDSNILCSALAIIGHASNGHGLFKNSFTEENKPSKKYPNTTINHVLKSLQNIPNKEKLGLPDSDYFNPHLFRTRVQKNLDDFVETMIDDFFRNPFVKEKKIHAGTSLLGLVFPCDLNIDLIEFYRGFYFATNMDSYNPVRFNAMKKYGWEMGGGNIYAADLSKLNKLFFSLDELSLNTFEKFNLLNSLSNKSILRLMKKYRMIKNLKKPRFSSVKDNGDLNWEDVKQEYSFDVFRQVNDFEKVYIRERKGSGVSDDTAIMLSAILPHSFRESYYIESRHAAFSRILGAICGDLVDTDEKASNLIFSCGQDEFIGNYLNYKFKIACKSNKFRNFHSIRDFPKGNYSLLKENIIRDFTIAAANTPDCIIHSSKRHFTKEQEHTCMYQQILSLFDNLLNKFYDNEIFLPNQLKTEINIGFKIGYYGIPLKKYVRSVYEIVNNVLYPLDLRERNIREMCQERIEKYY